jgi:hypothetical protein
MTRVRTSAVCLVPCLLLSVACESGAPFTHSDSLDNADNVRTWAITASAVAVYSHAHTPVSFADGRRSFNDTTCPTTTDDGTTVTIAGDCTDSSGTQWLGSATVARTATGDSTLTVDEFGSFGDPNLRATTTGKVAFRRLGQSLQEFDADLVRKGGLTTTITYLGRVEGNYDTRTVWNGSGEVERQGLVAPTGVISATTVNETVDNSVCSGQPVSGQTTINTSTQTAVVSYDGATDCDADDAARWSVDGEDRGLITGISCQAAAPGGGLGRSGLAGLAFLVAIVLVRSLRRRPISAESSTLVDSPHWTLQS